MSVLVYVDGSCNGNPGRGGWAYVVIRNGATTEASGSVAHTTNNRMELQAAIEALAAWTEPTECEIRSDSQYVVNGVTSWIERWKAAGWRTAGNKIAANRDQWEKLDRLCQIHSVTWRWVKGHAGDPHNDRCDLLASRQAGITDAARQMWQPVNETRRAAEAARRQLARERRSDETLKVAGEEDRIQDYHAAGMSLRKLAARYGVQRGLINHILKGRDLESWINRSPTTG